MPTIPTACAIIYRYAPDKKIECLMTKRALTASFLPGVYEFPGGHIELGETEVAGLLREIKEELNLEIRVERLFDSFTYQYQGQTVIETIYLATPLSDLTAMCIQEDEIDSYRFIGEADIDSIVAANKNPHDPEIAILRRFFTDMKEQNSN